MSCSGCRVLRKGCSEKCVLRPCLDWIETSDAQSNATVFLAKFFGRAALMSFISSVPENQRPAVFQSLLFEAAGRTVNPVNGALGLLWTGNWHICQAAVETVLHGGALRSISEFTGDASEQDNISECTDMFNLRHHSLYSPPAALKRRRFADEQDKIIQFADLDLSLMPNFHQSGKGIYLQEDRRLGSPSLNSEESGVTTFGDQQSHEPKLLNLFN